MTEPTAPHVADTLPAPASIASVNGSAPQPPAEAAPPLSPAQAGQARQTRQTDGTGRRRKMHTRISGARTALIAGFVILVLVLIFVIQNAHTVSISYLGAHVHLSLAVALLLAVVAGALIMAAAETARITQLRQMMRRDRYQSDTR
jgi:lipopolysaccharide assembly protein A